MPENKIEFDKRVKGGLSENEDWWRIVISGDNPPLIEHQWSYIKAGPSIPVNESGTKRYSIDEFRAMSHPQGRLEKMEAALKASQGVA